MRNPDRLDSFYDELKEIHKNSFSDMRFGQTMHFMLSWIELEKKRDPFYIEDEEMLDIIKEFAEVF